MTVYFPRYLCKSIAAFVGRWLFAHSTADRDGSEWRITCNFQLPVQVHHRDGDKFDVKNVDVAM